MDGVWSGSGNGNVVSERRVKWDAESMRRRLTGRGPPGDKKSEGIVKGGYKNLVVGNVAAVPVPERCKAGCAPIERVPQEVFGKTCLFSVNECDHC